MKQDYWMALISTLLVVSYLLIDELKQEYWIFAYLPFVLLSIVFIAAFIRAFYYDKNRSLGIGIAAFLLIIVIDSFSWEIFKSPKLLEAHLRDDLSGLHLVLRKNKTFEMQSHSWLTVETMKGKYDIYRDKIIFLDRPYDNDFIPDTVTVFEDKIILKFDNAGKPNTSYGNFFTITSNSLH